MHQHLERREVAPQTQDVGHGPSLPRRLALGATHGRLGKLRAQTNGEQIAANGPIGRKWRRGNMANITLTVNRQTHKIECEPTTLLVEALREHLRLTGTHVGCDTSQCGACTVHVDGRSVKSCTMLAAEAEGAEVTTIEGLAQKTGELHPMQAAFREHHGLQCGFCTPGMIMSSTDLVHEDPRALRGRGPPLARGQPVPVHRLPQHRQGRARRRRLDARR